MLGLDSLTSFPQLKVAFNKTLRIVDPNEDKDPGVESGELRATQKLTEAYKVYKDLHDAEAASHRRVNQRPGAAVPPSSSSLSGGRGQAAAARAPPVAAPGPAPQPLPHGPSQDLFAAYENTIFRHCIVASDNNSIHNWDAGLQFLSDKEHSGNLFELRNFTFTSALLIGKDHTIFLVCMRKVLVLAHIFPDSIRARDTLRQLARLLPTLLLSHGYKSIQARSNRSLKGDLEWLWATCTKAGRARQARLTANPHTGKARTATQLDALAQKATRAGNHSKSCQAVCSDSSPALGSNTLKKLKAKNPQRSVLFDKRFWPTPADMDALRQEDDWQRVEQEHFSVDKIRQYFARSPSLSAQDPNGWRPREHVACLFGEDNEELHKLIQKHMARVMPFIKGNFYPGHREEAAGGKYFALEKPNEGGAPVDV